MMRGTATGLPIAHPIVRELPAIYQDSEFIASFTHGLDEVMAPATSVIDCLHAYIDPSVTPPDFLSWLGEWVGLRIDEDWSTSRRRHLVAQAVDMFAERGTVAGLCREIELYTDGRAHIDDPGSTITSAAPGASFATVEHDRDRTVRVTVDVLDANDVNWAGLQELIRDAVPAHLPVEVELREVDHLEPSTEPASSPVSEPAPDPASDPESEGTTP